MTSEQIDRIIDRVMDRPFKYLALLAISSGLVMFVRAWWWVITEGPK